jgi:hypothetical protein
MRDLQRRASDDALVCVGEPDHPQPLADHVDRARGDIEPVVVEARFA